jgi:uncharacterized protein YraI
MELQEVCWDGMVWINLADEGETWWAVVNMVMKLGGLL